MRQRFCPSAPANLLALELKVDLSPYDALLPPLEGCGEEVA
jgi:hypothetical protein